MEEMERGRKDGKGREEGGGGGGGGATEGGQALSLFARRKNQQQDNELSIQRILTGTGLFLINWRIRW
ncbi:hypothetical protein LDENG_00119780 [Lucifuga dentata]|nr:hypothetical protein LDENG_00119780 [Lucifuga dentata]